MALDKEYFDGIQIDLVKKKYYNANKVNAVFADIQAQAQTLLEENEQMRAQLARLNGQKAEIGEAVLSAQQIYREIVDKANVRAAEIVAGAEKRREEIQAENLRQQEYAVKRVESCFSTLREQHLAAIEAINCEWQEFLRGLYTQDGGEAAAGEEDGALPEDIGDKLVAIAEGICSMDD